jgi:bacillithiol biosynthesis cysteine-adding enzyme BshC
MQKFNFHRQLTELFTGQENQLAYNQEQLLSFINLPFSIKNFEKQIKQKEACFTKENRELLFTELLNKYAHYSHSPKVKNNIQLIQNENTFTITTGHQLPIAAGPMYLIYKIIHVIRLAEELKKEYPENNFVPVFWMASEDHDFEEIQSVEIYSKNLKWDSDQKGAVGRFDIDGLDAVKAEICSFFVNQPESEVQAILDEYDGKNLSEANFKLIHRLFDSFGLIIIDGDNSNLKRAFIPAIEKELTTQFSFKALHKTNEKIQKEGFKLQVNGREINLFYLANQSRERILHVEDGFFIEGKGTISLEELIKEANEYPERFSPNVILRPVYQETILPNLCYVGGIGEISYWLQLKGVFDVLELPYPMIQVRTSILWIDPILSKKIEKVSLVLEDLFKDISKVKKWYLQEFAADEVDFTSLDVKIDTLKDSIIDKITQIDVNLEHYAQAEAVKLTKQLDAIKEKLVKTVKQRHDNAMKTIDQIYDKLFPNGGMQERTLNLFSLCSDGKVATKLEYLYSAIDPFDPDFIIIRE